MTGPVDESAVRLLGVALALLLPLDLAQYRWKSHTAVLASPWPIRAGAYATMMLAMFALRTDETIPFIYFQF